jgi:hypothetical protein
VIHVEYGEQDDYNRTNNLAKSWRGECKINSIKGFIYADVKTEVLYPKRRLLLLHHDVVVGIRPS